MADTLRILVATDNHVGYNERDAVRGDDSWRTFHEIMCLAKERDVDMVLLGGDLFHDNVPTRKSMYNVMRSLRTNCYGDKPCEIEMLSDGSLHFDATFGHANYEDTNINVAIPVFSIHGNHDDPSGDGHFASLDILEMSGLINYFGRIPQVDKIDVRPVLLQKGSTKVALFGLSNVRDERLHRTFRDQNVTFYRPTTQVEDWYNIGLVHQNHAAHGQTNHLPEHFLPAFLDLVIWGHEHECDIEPHQNPEMGFRVMQPGSSVATSLIPGEAVPKQVAILSITGREMKSEPIRLTTVRPFIYQDLVLAQDKEAVKIAKKDNHRHLLTDYLKKKVEELLKEARAQWEEARAEAHNQGLDGDEEQDSMPLPLLRLRLEITPPSETNSSRFDVENPQRFGNRFTGRVANPDNILQLHVKKKAATARKNAASEELKELMARPVAAAEFESIRVSQLVQEFLSAQSLTILPQNFFGDAVTQYIDKDDKHAMDMFVNESLAKQIQHLVGMHEQDMRDGADDDEEDLAAQIDAYRTEMEELFRSGALKNHGQKKRYKPRPDGWDTEEEGAWEDQPAALIRDDYGGESDHFMDSDSDVVKSHTPATRGRGRGRGRGGSTRATSTRGRGTVTMAGTKRTANGTAKVSSTSTKSRPKKKVQDSSDDDDEPDDADVVMLEDDNEDEDEDNDSAEEAGDDSQAMFVPDARRKTATTTLRGNLATSGSARGSRSASVTSNTKTSTARKPAAVATRRAPARTATKAANSKSKQSTLPFSASQASVLGGVEDIEDDDDDDAFEPVSSMKTRRR